MTYLCSAPFTTLNVKPEGARVCCSRHAPPVQQELSAWWNGEYMRTIRKLMFSHETLPDFCKACLNQGKSSPSRYSPAFDLSRYDAMTGRVEEDAMDIYLFTGRECTLGCVMCDSHHSITHERIFPHRSFPNHDQHFIDPRQLVSRDPNRKYIIYGGEPLLYRHLDELLEMTVPHARETAILTNGMHSVVRAPTAELIDRFKDRVVFVFSLDGAPETNELIRVNCRTTRVMKHLNEARHRGWKCDIHFTISTLNAAKFTEFVLFLRREGLLDDPELLLNVAAVLDPLEYNPCTLPIESKQDALRAIRELDVYLRQWNLPPAWRTRLELANRGVEDSLQVAGNASGV